MNQQEMLARLEAADPARGVPVGPGDAETVLQRAAFEVDIAPPRRRRALAVAAVAVAVIVVIAGAAALLRPKPKSAPGPASNCMSELAAHLQPAPYDGVTATYEYLRLRAEGGTSTEIPGRPGEFARFDVTMDLRTWLAADGSGRAISDAGPVSYADDASRAYFDAHPDELPPPHQEVSFEPRPRRFVDFDPTGTTSAHDAVVKVAAFNSRRVVPAGLRAAMLRYLAAQPGLTCDGTAKTDAGPGLLVTAPGEPDGGPDGSPTPGRDALVFDAATGELLAYGTLPGHWMCIYLERNMVNSK